MDHGRLARTGRPREAGERFFQDLAHAAQVELFTSTDSDPERIAAAMVSLAARLREILAAVAED